MAKLDFPFTQAGRYRKGRAGHHVTMIVVHWSAGWGEDDQIADYFKNPRKIVGRTPEGAPLWAPREASYHFAVGRGGSVVQLVDTDDTAWHAGGGHDWEGRSRINERSIGICLANRGPLHGAKDEQRAVEDIIYRGPHLKPGFHGYGKVFEGYSYEQMDALRQLVERLVTLHPSVTGITGHEDLVKGKGDPGPAFNVYNPRWSEMGLTRFVKDWKAQEWRPWETVAT